MDKLNSSSELKEHITLQTKERQQVKKDSLAKALRDNLYRRKAVILSSTEMNDEDSLS